MTLCPPWIEHSGHGPMLARVVAHLSVEPDAEGNSHAERRDKRPVIEDEQTIRFHKTVSALIKPFWTYKAAAATFWLIQSCGRSDTSAPRCWRQWSRPLLNRRI